LAGEFVVPVLLWLAVIKLLHLGTWPALDRTLGNLSAAAAYPASILLFTLGSWYCGLSGLPVWLALLPFLAAIVYAGSRRFYTRERLQSALSWDLAFLIPFLFMLEVRWINPTISYAEKFMDHAILASIMRLPTIPPLDPWYAGGTLDVYYYIGYWMSGVLGLVSGVPSTVTFNLVLPTVLGLAVVSLYALGHLLLDRYRWLPVLALFIPNPSAIYHILIGDAWFDVLWGSTRTIANTINEYPIFSMLWGDVHPHVMSFFNQGFLLFLLVFACMRWGTLPLRGRALVCGLAALALGSMPGFNSWDVLVYAPVTLVFGLLIWWRYGNLTRDREKSWMMLAAVPPLAIVTYLPFYLQLNSPGIGGIGIVPTPSEPVEFLLVHGFFLAVLIAFCAPDIRKRPYLLLAAVPFVLAGYPAAAIAAVPLVYLLARRRFAATDTLAILGLLIILATELVYLKDNMGETYFRMNTVFKFYLPAWILMGTASLAVIGGWLERADIGRRMPARAGRLLPVLAVALLLAAPFAINVDFGYGSHTLDGAAYLEGSHPGDAAAIAFLRDLPGDHIIVEAEGGDYTYYSRVSSFTGIPAVIGMPFHEYMWRGDEGRISERSADVRRIYEQPSRTIELSRAYNATLLYVGAEERDRYTVSIPTEALELIYDAEGVQIYLCGVEGAEREGSLRKGGGESGAPSSYSHRTGILYAGGSPR
jgi:YYY domain-containing protein